MFLQHILLHRRLGFNCYKFAARINNQTTKTGFVQSVQFRFVHKEIIPNLDIVDCSNIYNLNVSKQLTLRGKAASQHQETLIIQFISDRAVASPEEWKKLIDDVLGFHFGLISELNIDGKIMESCIFPQKLDLARSYLIYLKSQKKKFNGAVVSAFIQLCYACRADLTSADFQRVKYFTDYLRHRYLVLDRYVCDSIVKGLVLQDKVDDALEVANAAYEKGVFSSSSYASIAIRLLEKNDVIRSKEAMKKIAATRSSSSIDEASVKWINIFFKDKDKLEELLLFMRQYDLKPSKNFCDHLVTACQNLSHGASLVGEFGEISNSGKCSICKSTLAPIVMPPEEFESLRSLFLYNVLVGRDVFDNSTPQEMNTFIQLVQKEAPFDIIIDGLNVSYMIGTSVPKEISVQLIEAVVKHFCEQNLKILVIGRNHMKKWPGLLNFLQEKKVTYYFIENISEDDPFTLYAALYSGSQAMIVTRDLFRSEKFQLQSEKESFLFKRWSQSHQIFITYVSPSGKIYTRSPISFEMNIQKDDSGNWHIPYVDHDETKGDEYGIHAKWLCLRRTS